MKTAIGNNLRVTLITWVVITVALTLSACTPESEVNKPASKPDLSDPERLNVSEPTFSTAGVRFRLDDTRPNTSLWVSINVGEESADKGLMSWISLSGVQPGVISKSFRDFKYLDAGLNALKYAKSCKVTIGARLKNGDKVVYTAYNPPISEFRRALLDSAR